ncbi:Ribosomal RNA small subunit methyltransferase G [Candidatus Sulfotelmatomonas gaucii]|uniref:Ribosomal RNA small subunit methyltransferase G n=1 Tax=Candidatus Sulfuritelmatomonas gaucii TaxID=2043161 RepID=A0A2N9L2Y5_9BACT|nr:Ribosomal RNA small subunit methyltransferase G [Candidatus Sulfotelmatomonas gaucii]
MTSTKSVAFRLNELLVEAGVEPLGGETASFEAYLSLFIRWNERVNLSSFRSEEELVPRHFIESIAVARMLPEGIASLLDFGSGGGLPGIPIALCRPEIAVTLAESRIKKAAFLEEAVRILEIQAQVWAKRAETLREVFDCVTLRAVDKMPKAIAAALRLVVPNGWLALMTTDADAARLQAAAGAAFRWAEPMRLPGSESRLLALGRKVSSAI